ncbi:MAG: hypothetical protein HY052_03825 [Proteobacteria bacterium]|nr:hypothetical protein [Pseudomonadota bacterium]
MKNQCCAEPGSADASCEKKKCCGILLKGMLVGGLVMFVYLSISWMMMPWHKAGIQSFKNESAVASVMAGNVDKSGIYFLSQQKASKARSAAMVPSRPFAFMSVFTPGLDAGKMNGQMAFSLLLALFNALLLTALLKKGTCCGGCPVMFSLIVGLVVACAGYLPNLIWYHFPLSYTLVGMADDIISFTLAGAVISKFVLNSGACKMGRGSGSCSIDKDAGKKPGSCH